jgi:hypothetical protein
MFETVVGVEELVSDENVAISTLPLVGVFAIVTVKLVPLLHVPFALP